MKASDRYSNYILYGMLVIMGTFGIPLSVYDTIAMLSTHDERLREAAEFMQAQKYAHGSPLLLPKQNAQLRDRLDDARRRLNEIQNETVWSTVWPGIKFTLISLPFTLFGVCGLYFTYNSDRHEDNQAKHSR